MVPAIARDSNLHVMTITVERRESAQLEVRRRFLTETAMIRTRSLPHRFAITVAVTLALMAGSTTGHAFTAEQQRLCTGDAFRLCGSEIPSLERITSCMRQRIAELSQGCRAVFEK
jgi:hypothetical protein